MTAIYVASARAEYPLARQLAGALAAAGHRIVSTWHTLADLDGSQEVTDIGQRRELLTRCRRDIQRAAVMVAWTARGVPRMTIAEIAIMLEALDRPVVWIQGPAGEGGNILDAHPLVTIVRDHSMAAVFAAVEQAAQKLVVV